MCGGEGSGEWGDWVGSLGFGRPMGDVGAGWAGLFGTEAIWASGTWEGVPSFFVLLVSFFYLFSFFLFFLFFFLLFSFYFCFSKIL